MCRVQDVQQALPVVPGARRAQHQPHAAAGADAQRPGGGRDRARVHECAVCGLEFSMGQALGGHMRRHRGEAPPPAAHDDPAAQTDRDMPDLNLPPLDDGNGSGSGSGSGDGQGPLMPANSTGQIHK